MVHTSGQERASTAGSIVGGFVLVPVAALMVAWRSLDVGDFRAWLACWEIRARRQGLEAGRPTKYTTQELAKLLEISERRTRASVRRLVSASLIDWSLAGIEFPEQVLEAEDRVNDSIGRGRGSLAIPRRLLRFLAAGARPALIAAVLGILLRCLSRRRDGFDGRGRVKASWIAGVFGVSIPVVKTARRELIALAWIEAEPAEQWSLNRWGRAYRIDLAWEAPRAEGPRLIPPRPEIGSSLIPPDLQTQTPSGREKHQEPASSQPGQTGGWLGEQGTENQSPDLPAPTLADVRVEDLRDVDRTLELHDQAVAKGLLGRSEAGRLKFVALAEHARQVGKANPPGLFAALLRRGAWQFITAGEEDAARRKLKAHDRQGDHLRLNPKVMIPARRSTFTPLDDQGFEARRCEMLRQLAGRQGMTSELSRGGAQK